MKLFTTASYYGSGSSAITDLLSEYSTVKALDSDFECRIAYDMFGLSDLEYYLVENNHRHNSSTAINMFLRLCGIYGLNKNIRFENYSTIFPNFHKSVIAYINELAPMSYKGGSHVDIYMKSDLFIFLLKIRGLIYNIFHKFESTNDDSAWLLKGVTPYERELGKIDYHISYPINVFLEATQRFTENLFGSVNMGNNEYLMVDQLVPVSNTMRFVKYFKDLKVICIDRDPRDVYYNETKKWNKKYTKNRWVSAEHPGDGKTPYQNVKTGHDLMLTDYPLQNASYACLRNFTVGYTLPATAARKIKLSGVRFYVSGSNLFYIWGSGYKGINPESRMTSGDYSSAMISGYQRGGFPLTSTISAGFDINF